ncbi:MAG: diadenylate cyclase [Mycoplasmataceae bacterium]|jgi:diadenylate cyclase|nr:diadenylate cyclase [Mycoplasmataceae bacterium]
MIFDISLVLIIIILLLLIGMIVTQILLAIYGNEIKKFFSRFRLTKKRQNDDIKFLLDFFNNLASTLVKLSSDHVGALIVIENNDSLAPYINIGNKIDSIFFPEFVTSIFYNHKSALHDGAMIIRNWRIASLSSYLPMTKKIVNVEYGARHRAAFGICEKYDCFSFVVSETNGNITAVHLDEFKRLSQSPEKLVIEIVKLFASSGMFREHKSLRKTNIITQMEEFNKQNQIKQK